MDSVIAKLKDDANYYGEVGRQYLSASDVGILLSNPKMFGQPREDDKALAQGRAFHQYILEPAKFAETPSVDVSTRTTKAYKDTLEASGLDFMLLTKEVEEAKEWAQAIMANIHFYDAIFHDNAEYEVPAVGEIGGIMWKGKADIVRPDILIDLKTTREIGRFRYSAASYHYDAQCYVYQELFGKPLVFYVVDKETKMLGVFKPTDNFVRRGRDKVMQAIEVYKKFFSPQAAEDVKNHYTLEELD